MSRYLLDVNVLIALIDPAHVQHEQVHLWFGRVGHKAFATCPITENGLLRIVGHPKYPNSPGPPSTVASTLAAIRGLPGHAFPKQREYFVELKLPGAAGSDGAPT